MKNTIEGYEHGFREAIRIGLDYEKLRFYAFPVGKRKVEQMVSMVIDIINGISSTYDEIVKVKSHGSKLRDSVITVGLPISDRESYLFKESNDINQKLANLIASLEKFRDWPFLKVKPDDRSKTNLARAQVIKRRAHEILNDFFSLQQLLEDLDQVSDLVDGTASTFLKTKP